MAETDSNGQLSAESRIGYLRTVFGYLKLIGRQNSTTLAQPHLVEFFLNNEQNLNHLIDALVNCVKFDFNSLSNFYELRVDSTDETAHMSNYHGLETYLHDKCVYEQLRSICAYLGRSDAARLVVDQLLNSDLSHIENRRYKLEALFIIDLILLGLEKREE